MAHPAVVCNVDDFRNKINLKREDMLRENRRDVFNKMLAGITITPDMHKEIIRSHSEYDIYNIRLKLCANQAKIGRRPPKKTHDEIIKKSNEEIYIAHMRECLIKHKEMDNKRKRVGDVFVVEKKKKM